MEERTGPYALPKCTGDTRGTRWSRRALLRDVHKRHLWIPATLLLIFFLQKNSLEACLVIMGDQKRSLVVLVSSLSSKEYKVFSLPAAEHCLEHQTDKVWVPLVHCTKGNVKAQISNLVQTRNSRLARRLLCVSIVSEPRLSRSWRQRSEGFCPPDTLSNFFLIRSLASAMELISIKLSRVVFSIHPPLQSTKL